MAEDIIATPPSDETRSGLGWVGWLGGALIGLAGVALLFVGYLTFFSSVQASRSQDHLVAALNGTAGLQALSGIVPNDGAPVAVLTIPALGLDEVVVAGTSADDLEQAPGYLIGSAPFGTRGNAVIAGKRATFGAPFARLTSLAVGDRVNVVSSLGSFDYTVTKVGSVASGQVDPAGPLDKAELTLVTADSSTAPSGLDYAQADLVGKPLAYVARRAITAPPVDFGLAGDSGDIIPAIGWFVALVLAAAATIYGYRRARKPLVVYMLSLPVLLAVCVLLFGCLAGLLPATQ